MTNAIRHIGPAPSTEVQFLGCLMWAAAADVRDVLPLVADDDLEDPNARVILFAIRWLVGAGQPHDGTAVGDQLQRSGRLGGESGTAVKKILLDAITSGAASNHLAPKMYARAVVSDAYRRRYEILGKSLVEAADTMAEDDLLPMLRHAGTDAVSHAERLSRLRGEVAA
ncbi:hypothetical protein KUG88_08705 [Rhodococcus rhodochrous]|uniref:hypothetical protein n=1 Tax=Rhodococcus rhodochrous TaxID=1829 RepID=UPI001E2E7BC1|nr:hypothetical protein [Rhodococcus rhodochrous]MCB8910209.1 hypothetical protein [Rhodococcus rhodochrous]